MRVTALAGYPRFSWSLLLALLAAAGVGGCAGMGATTQLPLITLGIEEPARWIEPRGLPRYQCELGSLVRDGGGWNPVAGLDALTSREREVLAEIAKGRSNREIARALTVSEKTVKAHVSSVLAKLGVQDRTQAALVAVRHEQGALSSGCRVSP